MHNWPKNYGTENSIFEIFKVKKFTYFISYFHQYVSFSNHKDKPEFLLYFFQKLQKIDSAKVPNESRVEDQAENVHKEKETDIPNVGFYVRYDCLIMPYFQFDATKDFSIGSIVHHQYNNNVWQWYDALSLTQDKTSGSL